MFCSVFCLQLFTCGFHKYCCLSPLFHIFLRLCKLLFHLVPLCSPLVTFCSPFFTFFVGLLGWKARKFDDPELPLCYLLCSFCFTRFCTFVERPRFKVTVLPFVYPVSTYSRPDFVRHLVFTYSGYVYLSSIF